jgi:hypothetical protein
MTFRRGSDGHSHNDGRVIRHGEIRRGRSSDCGFLIKNKDFENSEIGWDNKISFDVGIKLDPLFKIRILK